MKLLIVRHGKAKEREDFQREFPGVADAERPLTSLGRKRLRQTRWGLKLIFPDVEIMAASPFVRARDTAHLLEILYPRAQKVEWAELIPDQSAGQLLRKLQRAQAQGTRLVAVIGHEPQLSRFVGYCLTATEVSVVKIKKGGAVLIQWESSVRKGQGQLSWMLTPSQLRKISLSAKRIGNG